jgi:hypothetical protein
MVMVGVTPDLFHPKFEHAPRGLLVRRRLALQLVAPSMLKGVSPGLCVVNLSQVG